jgi:hypothetical protein
MAKKKLFICLALVWLVAAMATAPMFVTAWKHKQSFDRAFAAFGAALVHKNWQEAHAFTSPEFRRVTPSRSSSLNRSF